MIPKKMKAHAYQSDHAGRALVLHLINYGRHRRLQSSSAIALWLPASIACPIAKTRDFLDLCKFPFFVTKRTDVPCLQPPLHAVKVKDVAAATKSNGQTCLERRRWIRLVFNTRTVQRISTYSTCIRINVPTPKRYRVPLFNLKRNFWTWTRGTCPVLPVFWLCRHRVQNS